MELTRGLVTGELPPALLPIEEHGMKLLVDIQHGHKTGYYTDQRDNRGFTPAATLKACAELFLLYRWFRRIGTDGGCSSCRVDTSPEALDVHGRTLS